MADGTEQESLLPVEGWRGLAALMVLVSHWAPPLQWDNPLTRFAFTGVDLFFVISGFVFAPLLWGVRSARPGGFVLRRVMRIYPAYVVALLAYVAVAVWQGRPVLYLPEHLLMGHVQSREMAFYYSAPFWSLPSEVEFYAVLTLWAWALGWASGRKGTVPIKLLLAVTVVALLTRLALIHGSDGVSQNASYVLLHHLPGLLVEFLFGAWAWKRHAAPWAAGQRVRWLAAGLIGAALCTAAYQVLESGPFGHHWIHGQVGLAMAGCFAPVLAATAGCTVKGPWGVRACHWAGRMSYGTYLLHTAWALALVTWTPSVGLAWAAAGAMLGLMASVLALHLLVEEPARRWARARAKA